MNDDLEDILDRLRNVLLRSDSADELCHTLNYMGVEEEEAAGRITDEREFDRATEHTTSHHLWLGLERFSDDLDQARQVAKAVLSQPELSWTLGAMIEACGGCDEVTFLDYDSLPQSATVWANQLSRLIVPMRPELLRAIAAIRDQASESIDEPADNNGNHRSESGLTSRNKAIIVPVSEIARRLRVTRCVVQKWTLEESFPKRADASEKSVFRWSEVVTWRIEHGNRRGSTE